VTRRRDVGSLTCPVCSGGKSSSIAYRRRLIADPVSESIYDQDTVTGFVGLSESSHNSDTASG